MTMTFYYFFSREIGDLSENGQLKIIVFTPFIFIDIFSPPGEPISRHQLRRSLFDVAHYAFTGRLLVATITSARE